MPRLAANPNGSDYVIAGRGGDERSLPLPIEAQIRMPALKGAATHPDEHGVVTKGHADVTFAHYVVSGVVTKCRVNATFAHYGCVVTKWDAGVRFGHYGGVAGNFGAAIARGEREQGGGGERPNLGELHAFSS
jgi:hypothetical protein